MAKEKVKKSRARRFLRFLVIGGGLAGLAYAIAQRQKPGPCVPAGNPEERVIVKDEENIGMLGELMVTLIKQLLQDPDKMAQLESLNLTVAIKPKSQPESAITMTFSDGYAVVEPSVAPGVDLQIICELDVLMRMAAMGYGLDALKYMVGPEGKELAQKFQAGELQIKGLASHPFRMMKFSKFLSVPNTGSV